LALAHTVPTVGTGQAASRNPGVHHGLRIKWAGSPKLPGGGHWVGLGSHCAHDWNRPGGKPEPRRSTWIRLIRRWLYPASFMALNSVNPDLLMVKHSCIAAFGIYHLINQTIQYGSASRNPGIYHGLGIHPGCQAVATELALAHTVPTVGTGQAASRNPSVHHGLGIEWAGSPRLSGRGRLVGIGSHCAYGWNPPRQHDYTALMK
jgi:hypothetical protein